METESSLPHSQDLATCPYPKPARSSPYPHIPEEPSYYYPPIYAWASQVGSFLQVSPPKPYYTYAIRTKETHIFQINNLFFFKFDDVFMFEPEGSSPGRGLYRQ